MRIKDIIGSLVVAAVSLMCAGCMTMGGLAPGISLIDPQTGKSIAHVKDQSLGGGGPWGAHDAMTLLPARSTDKMSRAIYARSEGWCVREFDADGGKVAEYSLPRIKILHDRTDQYAFSPRLDRVVYCDDISRDIVMLDLKKNNSSVLLKGAVNNPFAVQWIKWIDDNSVAIFVGDLAGTAYSGSIILLPVGGGQPHILYQNPNAELMALSPDMKYLAVELMFGYPEPSQLFLVDLSSGSQQLIGTFPRTDEGLLWGLAWSPDGKSIAYSRGRTVELYSLGSNKSRLLSENDDREDDVYAVSFLDNSRVCCSWYKKGSSRIGFEILDARTGNLLLDCSFRSTGRWQAFDNGNRIALEGR